MLDLKEKLTGDYNHLDRKIAFIKLYENHYNACYSNFARKNLEKNHLRRYLSYIEDISRIKINEPGILESYYLILCSLQY